ncbi:hypothetical protein T265_12163, partial [Opisthorchis viverrini]
VLLHFASANVYTHYLVESQDLYKTDQLAGKLLPCLSFL